MLKQFLPRFDRRFGVPTQCPEPAFRPLQRDLPLEQVLCFKHRRRVARDNTVKYQRHTLQLLPDSKRRSYAGTVVEVLEGSRTPLGTTRDCFLTGATPGPLSLIFAEEFICHVRLQYYMCYRNTRNTIILYCSGYAIYLLYGVLRLPNL